MIRIKPSPRRILAAIGLAAAAIFLMAQSSPAQDQTAKPEVITISAVGDVMMGTEGMLPADDGVSSFTSPAPYLQGRDVVFLNLEGTLTDRGAPTKKFVQGRSYIFKTPPHYGRYLQEAGFNMASLANNHANDYGPEGKKMTMETLAKYGLTYSDQTGRLAELNVRGTKIVMAAFFIRPDKHNLNDIPGAKKIIAALSQKYDVVIVSFHGGKEGRDATHVAKGMDMFLGEQRGDLVKFSHAVIDAGADLVIGHGPHVPRAVEVYKDRLIAYSLGNFCTGKGLSVQGVSGYAPLLQVEVDKDGRLVGGRIVSFTQAYDQPPVLDKKKKPAKLMYQLGTEDFPTSNALDSEGNLVAPAK